MDYLSAGGCTDSTSSSCGTSHGFSYGVEGGYGRMFARRLIVRAQLGVGDHAVYGEGTATTCQGNAAAQCSTTTSHSSIHFLYLEPALMSALIFGPVLVGVDASIFFMPQVEALGATESTTFTQFRIGAQLGVRL